jgi:hypothetical protein
MSNEVAVQTEAPTTALAKIDNGKPALYNPAAFDQIWRASKMFASSDLVPTAYKNKPENCFIAIEMADRMGIAPFAMLQSLVIIQGKPSMEAKLIIALVNDSGLFVDPLEYEVVGDDPHAENYKVRAFATTKKGGKLCQGPWITYKMVKGEGWLSKGGSKWQTMPGIMFSYRAASFFAKLYCPNITMGMQTREEMEDSKPIDVTPGKDVFHGAGPAPALMAPATAPALDAPPPLAPITEDGEIIDIETGEITEAPPVAEKKPTKPAKVKPAPAAAAAQEEPPHPAETAETVEVAETVTETPEATKVWPDSDAEDAEESGDLF